MIKEEKELHKLISYILPLNWDKGRDYLTEETIKYNGKELFRLKFDLKNNKSVVLVQDCHIKDTYRKHAYKEMLRQFQMLGLSYIRNPIQFKKIHYANNGNLGHTPKTQSPES